jgi:fibronectin-binding autotransporter adhesin
MKPKNHIFRSSFLPAHIALSLGLAVAGLSTHSAQAVVTDTWVGNTDANWNTAANWDTTVVPTTGDSLVFGAAGSQGATLNNNITGLSVNNFTINSTASAFTFNGSALTLTGTLTDNATSNGQHINLALGGAGGVNNAGTQRLYLNAANTYSGATIIGSSAAIECDAAAAYSANSDYTVNGILESYTGSGGYSITIGALNGSGNVYNTGSGSNQTTTFTVGGTGNSGSFSGVIHNGAWGSQKTALTKSGAGTQTLSGANTYTGATTVNGGTLAVTTGGQIANTGGGFVVGSVAGTNAALAITGGSVSDSTTTGNAWASAMNVGFGSNGSGFVSLSSGTLAAQRQLFIGNSNGSTNGAYGAMTMTGGTLNVGSYFGIGFNTNTSGVFNQTGGVVTQSQTGGAGSTILGSGAGAFGVANLGGGTFNASAGGIYVAENGAGTGILNVSGSAAVTAGNVGLRFGNNAAASTGILNLLGGTVTTNIVVKGNSGAGSSATFNFNGGTLKASGANTSFFAGLDNAYVYGGGGTIHNNGYAITIAQSLLAPGGSGASATGLSITGGSGYVDTPVVKVSGGGGTGATAVATVSGGFVTGITITNPGTGYTGVPTFTLVGGGGSGASVASGSAGVVANTSGGLTFTGTGTTTLTGTNTYTGATTVTNGKLIVNGSISTSAVTVQSGATLGGMGTVGALTVQSGGTISPGNSPGILTVNGNYNQAGTLSAELNGTSVGDQYDQVHVTGTVTLSGALAATLGYTPANGDILFILAHDGTDAINGTFADKADGSTFFLNGTEWKISYEANYTGTNTGTFTNGNDVALMAIPEPRAALLGGLGMLALLRRRRH